MTGLPPAMMPALDVLDTAFDAVPEVDRATFGRKVDELLSLYLMPLVQAWHTYPAHREDIVREFGDTVETFLLAPRGFPCHDWNAPTAPHVGGKDGPAEYYMVRDDVWSAAVGEDRPHFLCIGCLESRLGRALHRGDFTDCQTNGDADPRRSARLVDRLTAQVPA